MLKTQVVVTTWTMRFSSLASLLIPFQAFWLGWAHPGILYSSNWYLSGIQWGWKGDHKWRPLWKLFAYTILQKDERYQLSRIYAPISGSRTPKCYNWNYKLCVTAFSKGSVKLFPLPSCTGTVSNLPDNNKKKHSTIIVFLLSSFAVMLGIFCCWCCMKILSLRNKKKRTKISNQIAITTNRADVF